MTEEQETKEFHEADMEILRGKTKTELLYLQKMVNRALSDARWGFNERQHLFACFAEECGEVVQVIGKIFRFGELDSHPKTGNVPNIELLRREFNDIVAVAEMLDIHIDQELIEAKQARVRKYMAYANRNGEGDMNEGS